MTERLHIAPGVEVVVDGRRYQITQVPDLERALVRDVETGEARQFPLTELMPASSLSAPPQDATVDRDAQQVTDAHWQIAQARFAIIRPLLEQGRYSRAEVEARAEASGYGTATLYRWLHQYQRSGFVSALVPDQRGAARGQHRLSPEVDAIVDATIQDTYLTEQKPSIRRTALEVERRCRNARFPAPHPNTVRHRILQLSAHKRLRSREGAKAAHEVFAPIRGPYPDADWPLAVWQIDHTPADIILVDDLYRRPVGRPWITVAIDVFSRMIAGFYVSFDPPGAMSVGLCLAHAMLSKEMQCRRMIELFRP